VNIDNAVLDVLSNATVEGNSLKLNGQLARPLYVATNKVLEAAGGKWNRKAQSHIFESDAAEIMDQIILTGKIVNKKQELGYFPTTIAVVERLLELAEIEPGMEALEPSAGTGNIVRAMIDAGAHVTAVEIDPNNYLVLHRDQALTGGIDILHGDFLTYKWNERFDRVVMNPPFGHNSAPSHLLKAMTFLKPGGRLVAVMPSSVTFRTDRLNKMVRAAVEVGGSIEPLPDNSFAESGTNVNTVIVTINS
jgi:predicted RNA methylase